MDGWELCTLGPRVVSLQQTVLVPSLTNQSSRADVVNETRVSSVWKPSYLLLRPRHACDFAVVTQ